MKKQLKYSKDKNTEKKSQLDIFEILEDIIPLCDAGKAFVKGEASTARPIIDNDISRFSAGRHKKPR